MSKNNQENPANRSPITRKQFLLSFWWLAAGVLLLQIAGAVGWLLWPKKRNDNLLNTGDIAAGNITDYQVGDVVRFENGKFFISKVRDDAILAMSWACTHLRCPSFWEPDNDSLDSMKEKGRIGCRCHGSYFDRLGNKYFGPAPRPLDLFKAVIDKDGDIFVDTSVAHQRLQFEESQLVRKR